ncbi:MAG TPA: ribbon-helix-helix protein, CopG family [Acidimicrobiales bacterium]|nr:ribbon-helix-helix protein, CopG family [Acidimicrobiales bacterium]
MSKSEPFSLRLSPDVDALVSEEARRTRRSKGSVIEALAAEALKTRLFPGIAFRGLDWDRRAWVMGTALDVWQIVDAYRDFESVEQMASETDLSEPVVRLALAYYERFREEIDELLDRNRPSLEQLRTDFPFIDLVPAATS